MLRDIDYAALLFAMLFLVVAVFCLGYISAKNRYTCPTDQVWTQTTGCIEIERLTTR